MFQNIYINKIKNFSPYRLDREKVEELKREKTLLPIKVKAAPRGYFWLRDGSHRIQAALEMNRKFICAEIV
jgi:hypothetical protein